VYSVDSNKDIFKLSHRPVSHAILVFPTLKSMTIVRRRPPNGASKAGGVGKNRISFHRMLSSLRPSGVINTVLPDSSKLMTPIVVAVSGAVVDGGRRSAYDERPYCYAEDNKTAFN